MKMRSLLQVLPEAPIWSQMTLLRAESRLAQSVLVIVPPALQLDSFLDRLMALLVCVGAHPPCGSCRMCLNVLGDTHPDLYRIQPDHPSGVIKIEQIRALQTLAYQTPQLSEHQILLIYPAEAMNQAAASALLKMLEEPSMSTLFMLITTNPSLLLPTIVSRCQQILVQPLILDHDDPLALGQWYPLDSPRGLLYAQQSNLCGQLDDLFVKRCSPCELAGQWSEYPLQDLLWFFSALITKLIQLRLLPAVTLENAYQAYAFFSYPWRPEYLYAQLDSIYAILSQLQQNTTLNATLVWERILLDFFGEDPRC